MQTQFKSMPGTIQILNQIDYLNSFTGKQPRVLGKVRAVLVAALTLLSAYKEIPAVAL